jgi:alkaline phosphatase D
MIPMRITRPLAVAFVVACVASARAGDEKRLLSSGPLVGYQGHDQATVWVSPLHEKDAIEVVVRAESGGDEKRVKLTGTEHARTARVGGLAPLTTYTYSVLVNGADDETTRGRFRTGPLPGAPVKARLAVVSCMNAFRFPHQVAWVPLVERGPDLLLHLGDNVYANSVEKKVQREWHTAQRRVPEYARALRSMSTLAIWDDHDFGANDSDGTLPGKETSLELFKEVWPNPGAGLEGTPGVFYRVSYGDVDLFMLDTRYHRSPNFYPDGPDKKMLGDAQFEWLENEITASRATFKLIASGSTIDLGLKDAWCLYTKDRTRLLGLTKRASGICFLTGDIHTSLVVEREDPAAGYAYPEVIASGVAVNSNLHLFTTIDVDTTSTDPTLVVRTHRVGPKGDYRGNAEKTLRLSELGQSW